MAVRRAWAGAGASLTHRVLCSIVRQNGAATLTDSLPADQTRPRRQLSHLLAGVSMQEKAAGL
jgi:hypothetical protein